MSTKMSTVKTMNNATINVVCYKWKTLAVKIGKSLKIVKGDFSAEIEK